MFSNDFICWQTYRQQCTSFFISRSLISERNGFVKSRCGQVTWNLVRIGSSRRYLWKSMVVKIIMSFFFHSTNIQQIFNEHSTNSNCLEKDSIRVIAKLGSIVSSRNYSLPIQSSVNFFQKQRIKFQVVMIVKRLPVDSTRPSEWH